MKKTSILTLFIIGLLHENHSQETGPLCIGCVVNPPTDSTIDSTLRGDSNSQVINNFGTDGQVQQSGGSSQVINTFGPGQFMTTTFSGGRKIINYFGIDPPAGYVPNQDPNGPIINYFPSSVLTGQNGGSQGAVYNFYGEGYNPGSMFKYNLDNRAGEADSPSKPQFGPNCQCVGDVCNNCSFGK